MVVKLNITHLQAVCEIHGLGKTIKKLPPPESLGVVVQGGEAKLAHVYRLCVKYMG